MAGRIGQQCGRDTNGQDQSRYLPAGRLNVDGKYTELDDGKTLSTPEGVDISRRGNVYFVTY